MKIKTGISLLAAIMLIVCGITSMPAAAAVGEKNSNGFMYQITGFQEISISGYTGKNTEITIPPVIGDKPVTALGTGLFAEAGQITRLFVPDSIHSVDDKVLDRLKKTQLFGSSGSYIQSRAKAKGISFTVLEKGAYASLELGSTEYTVRKGNKIEPVRSFFPDYGTKKPVLSSKNEKIASVNGLTVNAVGAGTTEVTAKIGNITRKISVRVYRAADSISAPNYITLGKGETVEPAVTAAPSDCDKSRIKLTSSKPGTVSVNGRKIIGSAVGSAEIRIWYDGKMMNKFKVTVKNAPSQIKISSSLLNVGVGESFQLDSSVNSTSADITRKYRTSNSKIVAVERKGWKVTVKAKSKGTAYITVRTYNGKESSCRVNVLNAPGSISLSKKEIVIGAGESFQLYSSVPSGSGAIRNYYVWNSKTAAVDKNGKVTGKNPGQTTVAVKTFNGKKAQCTVKVKAAPQKINIGRKKLTLVVGESYTLNSFVDSKCASSKRSFSSSDSSVVSVEKNTWNGKIKALKPGTAKITVRSYNGKTDVCEVTVTKTSVRKRVRDTAIGWVGKNEKDGSYKQIVDCYNNGSYYDSGFLYYGNEWNAGFVSAVFIKAGKTGLIFPDSSCRSIMSSAEATGSWIENDAYVPDRGDVIFFNFSDSGSGDCRYGCDHAGIVVNVNCNVITFVEAGSSKKTGNGTVRYNTIPVNGRYIRGFILPDYTS